MNPHLDTVRIVEERDKLRAFAQAVMERNVAPHAAALLCGLIVMDGATGEFKPTPLLTGAPQ